MYKRQDAGYPILGDLKFYTKNDIHYIQDMLLAHRTLEFDSVLACNDSLGVGALKYAKARGIDVYKRQVAEVLAGNAGAKFERVGIQDKFGKSGKPDQLFAAYGLTAENIIEKCKATLA